MGEVPRSLTELKTQIGKDIYLHSLEMGYGKIDFYWDDTDQVPDQYCIEIAERWRATHPDIAEKFGRAAEQALLKLPDTYGDATAELLRELIRHATEMAVKGSAAKSIYAFAMLNSALYVRSADAQQYFEALVAYGRGE